MADAQIGSLDLTAAGDIDLNGVIQTRHDANATAGNDITVAVGAGILSTGDTALMANNDLVVDGDVIAMGGSTIHLVADADTSGAGDLIIGNNGYSTIETASGWLNQRSITLEGENVYVGGDGTGAGTGASIISLGGGDIKVIGNRDNDFDGNFVSYANSVIQASGNVNIDDPYDTTINGIIRRGNDIEIYALHDVNINALVESTNGSVTIMSDTDNGITGADAVRPGSVFLNAVVTAANDVTIDAHGGDILGLTSGQVNAAGDGNFHGQLVGTLAQPVAVGIDGTLMVAADGQTAGISGVINGDAGYLDVAKTTPGMVFYNGSWIAHEGSLARAFAKSIAMDNPYRGVETGGMEAMYRSDELHGFGAPYDNEIRDYRTKLDVYGDALYVPYPDLISDYRTCGMK